MARRVAKHIIQIDVDSSTIRCHATRAS
jgi:hypothetical protein